MLVPEHAPPDRKDLLVFPLRFVQIAFVVQHACQFVTGRQCVPVFLPTHAAVHFQHGGKVLPCRDQRSAVMEYPAQFVTGDEAVRMLRALDLAVATPHGLVQIARPFPLPEIVQCPCQVLLAGESARVVWAPESMADGQHPFELLARLVWQSARAEIASGTLGCLGQ